MKPEFQTKQLEAQPILGIRTKTTVDNFAQLMGPLFGEIFGYIQSQGQAPAGMPLAIYYSMDGKDVDMECAIPVASPIAGKGRIKAGELPAGTMATVTHLGPYDKLPSAWAGLTEWMQSQGLEGAGAPWEVHVTDPGVERDPSKWRTGIFFPVG